MTEGFSKNFLVHFDDCDPGGILFFGNYFKVAHRLFEEFVIHKGISWQEWFGCKTLLVPLKTAQAEYISPLWAGNNYNGSVKITKLGETSITVEVTLSDLQGQPCSKIQTVHVFVDATTQKKTLIPEAIRTRLS